MLAKQVAVAIIAASLATPAYATGVKWKPTKPPMVKPVKPPVIVPPAPAPVPPAAPAQPAPTEPAPQQSSGGSNAFGWWVMGGVAVFMWAAICSRERHEGRNPAWCPLPRDAGQWGTVDAPMPGEGTP